MEVCDAQNVQCIVIVDFKVYRPMQHMFFTSGYPEIGIYMGVLAYAYRIRTAWWPLLLPWYSNYWQRPICPLPELRLKFTACITAWLLSKSNAPNRTHSTCESYLVLKQCSYAHSHNSAPDNADGDIQLYAQYLTGLLKKGMLIFCHLLDFKKLSIWTYFHLVWR